MMLPLLEAFPYCDPLAIFSSIAEKKGALFLDSANHAAPFQHTNRYSYITLDPFETFTIKNHEWVEGKTNISDPFTFLQKKLSAFKLEPLPNIPPFQGGAAGYFGYEICHYIEKIPKAKNDDLSFPDIAIGLYDVVISFDHHEKKAWIVSTGFPETISSKQEARAKQRLALIKNVIKKASEKTKEITEEKREPITIHSEFSRETYEALIKKSKNYILEGDIFEVNLSQRFSTQLPAHISSFELYKKLREINPAPFAAYFNWDPVFIASASPERFISLQEGRVETRPIKGTLPRGITPEEDDYFAKKLSASDKDRAENTMIVDLMRNDLSRVCHENSVHVTALCALETYASVHHLVSVIEGQLKNEYHALDLLKATLPGGSITGAPKIRAMEIISELEPHTRGPYCGSLGFISFSENMDTSIIIRTFAIKNTTLTFQAGGAVTLHSNLKDEYQETLNKARALRKALLEISGTSMQD